MPRRFTEKKGDEDTQPLWPTEDHPMVMLGQMFFNVLKLLYQLNCLQVPEEDVPHLDEGYWRYTAILMMIRWLSETWSSTHQPQSDSVPSEPGRNPWTS